METEFGDAVEEQRKREEELIQLRQRTREMEQMLEKITKEAAEVRQKWKTEQEANDILKAEKASIEDQLEKEKTAAEEAAKKFSLKIEQLQKKIGRTATRIGWGKRGGDARGVREKWTRLQSGACSSASLYPELDLSGTGFYKDIVDGQVVEVED